MTDLPQLQLDLVSAGGRRRRRRRVRNLAATALVLATGVVALGSLEGAPEREVGPARAAPSERLERAYEVFRRPARPDDRHRGRIPGPDARNSRPLRSRLVGRIGRARYHLVETVGGHGGGLCLMSRDGGVCGPVETFLDGKRPIGSFSAEDGPSNLVFAFPDGVEEVQLTTSDGHVWDVAVRDNAVARRLRARPIRLGWTAPDGTPQRIDFAPAPAMDPADFYSVLERGPEQVVGEAQGAQAILASREGRVCLRLRALGTELEGCRAEVADVRRGIVVIVGKGERRVVAAAFPNHVRLVRLRFLDGTSRRVRVRDNAVLVADASQLAALRYRSVTDQLPASARSAVLNADPP